MATFPNAIEICSINIDGFSERSKLMLEKYQFEKKFHLILLQESGSVPPDRLEMATMSSISDENFSKNRGVVTFNDNSLSMVKLDEIANVSQNIDSAWSLVFINNKKIILGNIYAKQNYKQGIKEILNMLNLAEEFKNKYHAEGIILAGDFNSRHVSWGDKINDAYGKILFENLDSNKYAIISPDEPTFLSANGSSKIDLMVISKELEDRIEACYTDPLVHLYSGAPLRGHVPVITKLKIGNKIPLKQTTKKICIEDIPWNLWSSDLEDILYNNEEELSTLNDPDALVTSLDEALNTVTEKYSTTKIFSAHSKPFWTKSLTELCDKMREARKRYQKRNTPMNAENYRVAKETFDDARKEEVQKFLLQKTNKLNTVQSMRFWKEFNKIFKKKTLQKMEPLKVDDQILSEPKDMENHLFTTFFEGKHLESGDFDEIFHIKVNKIYMDILNEPIEDAINQDEDLIALNEEISDHELRKAIKSYNSTGKSNDNSNFNPIMFKHFGLNALKYIQKLANLCLQKRKWGWDKAEVIFLRKPGKNTYSKAGSYRPISISSYIGKLIEDIMAERIKNFMTKIHLYDPDQEGFFQGRNTVRYLNRLVTGIKSDLAKKLTTIGLFIDFEKAFDSVWKQGMIVKLYKLGIKGKILHLINDFLTNRKVIINVNSVKGDLRNSSDVGLPQGSVLSPILFRIYLMDFLNDIDRNTIDLLKFAGDGTIKVSGENTKVCLEKLQLVFDSIESWVKKWRMIVNCDPDKTELICFGTAENNISLIPDTFELCNKTIRRVKQTKVLGVILDENLSFKEHGKMVLQKLNYKWSQICKYSNSQWGFNQRVMVQLIKTIFHSTIFYAGIVWINQKSLDEITSLYYKIIKSAIGAVFNVRKSIIEVILGIPPLELINQTNIIKHYLKILLVDSPVDRMKELILKELANQSPNNDIRYHMRFVFKFLTWKLRNYPNYFNEQDKNIVYSNDFINFFQLSRKASNYNKNMVSKFTEFSWKKSLENEFSQLGYAAAPTPSFSNLNVKLGTKRKTEVLTMSLFYENNLMNSFLHRIDKNKFPNSLCPCQTEQQTAHHILFRCPLVPSSMKETAQNSLCEALGLENYQENYISLLNASRSQKFLDSALEIIIHAEDMLNSKIIL